MKVKVYLHESTNDETMICFYSKELGWMEFYDKDDTYSPLTYKSRNDAIRESYVPKERAFKIFERHGKITYLGEL